MSERLEPFIRLIRAAENLVDPDSDNNEYHRGQVELIMDASGLGLDSDDRYTVAKIIGLRPEQVE